MKKYWLIVLAFGLVLIASHAQADLLGIDDIAIGKTAVADATYSGYPASNAVDGDTATGWNSGDWGEWIPGTTNYLPHWLKVDLGQEYSLSHVDLYRGRGQGYLGFNLYYSINDQAWSDGWTNNTNWTLIGSGLLDDNNNFPKAIINFNNTPTRYLKSELGGGGTTWVTLNEIAAYSDAVSEVPEPTTMLLLGLGLVGLAGVRRRMHK
jgi:hypothetical protein